MNTLLRAITTQYTTWLSVLGQVLLFLLDSSVQAQLMELGLAEGSAKRLVGIAQLMLLLLTALGYSPLKRPPAPPDA